MKTDLVSRIASLFLIFLFLYNDVHASVRAFNQWEYINLESHTQPIGKRNPIANPSAQHLGSSSISRPQTKSAVSPPEPVANLEALASFTVSPLEESARIGMEMHMPVNDPRDDIFHFQLPADFKSEDWASVYLSYEVKGVADGRSLAKSINSRETFGERSLEADDQWHEVQEKVAPSDLRAGSNYLRFTIPNGMGLSAEVKNLRFNFNQQGDAQLQAARLERVVIDDPTYFRAVPQLESSPAYRLREVEMPALPQGIINVTAGAKAYQPSPQVAAQAELIGFKLNIGSLNSQRKLSELQVYYFDYERSAWQGVAIDSIDTQGEIAFVPNKGQTQYFGALIKSPEMPEASAFAPTMIQDIEAANPATGMNLMQPPSISRTGEAAISYPLEIPAGRKGMQPQLALSYNSDGGSSWVGYGWNIGIPSISVDTKWGVPTYDPTNQTESYVLNGQVLFEEEPETISTKKEGRRANRKANLRRSGEIRFFEKTRTSFKDLYRVGDGPQNYFWIERDAAGNQYYYGTYDGSTLDSNGVLRADMNQSSNIAKWMLCKVIDVWGNYVEYHYAKSEVSASGEMRHGAQTIVLDHILYTGHSSGNLNPKYKVEFNSSTGRVDARLNANYGFLVYDDFTLNNIKVYYDGTSLKEYKLNFVNSDATLYKSLLTDFEEWRSGSFFHEHRFTYHEVNLGFESNPEYVTHNVEIQGLFGSDVPAELQGVEKTLVINSPELPISKSTSLGINYKLGIGAGIAPQGKGNTPGKNFVYSRNIGGGLSASFQRQGFRDMNGDGIPDLYEHTGHGDFYYPIRRNHEGRLVKSNQAFKISNDVLNRSISQNFDYGFDFVAEQQLSPILTINVNGGMNWNRTNGIKYRYLTDYNSDGIPDLVNPLSGQTYIFFGYHDNFGNLAFTGHSNQTLNPVITGATPPSESLPESPIEIQIVRPWIAPFTGTVDISGTAAMEGSSQGEVKVAIEHNKAFLNSNFQTVNSSNPVSLNVNNVSVTKGDTIFFRTASGSTGYEDFFAWNPEVSYTGHSPIKRDGAGINYSNSTAEEAFVLRGTQPTEIPSQFKYKVTWPTLNVASGLSDDVTFAIIVNLQNRSSGEFEYEWEYAKTLNAGSTGLISESQFSKTNTAFPNANFLNAYGSADSMLNGISTENFQVFVHFEVRTNSNINWNSIDWRPKLEIDLESCLNGPPGNPERYPLVDYQVYNRLVEHNSTVSLSVNGTTEYRIWPDLNTVNYNSIYSSGELQYYTDHGTDNFKTVYLVQKIDGELIAKMAVRFNVDQTYQIYALNSDGSLAGAISGPYAVPSSGSYKFLGADLNSSPMYLEAYADDPSLGAYWPTLVNDYELINLDASTSSTPSGLEPSVYMRESNLLSDAIQHWGYFGWNETDLSQFIHKEDIVIGTEDMALANDLTGDTIPESAADVTAMESYFPGVDGLKFLTASGMRGEYGVGFKEQHYVYEDDTVAKLDRYSVLEAPLGFYRARGVQAPGKFLEIEIPQDNSFGEPTGTDIAYGLIQRSESYTLGYNYGGGPSVALDKDPLGKSYTNGFLNSGSQFYSQPHRQFMDLNGDGYLDIWGGENALEARVTNPLGGLGSVATTYAAGLKGRTMRSSQGESRSSDGFLNYKMTLSDIEDAPTLTVPLSLGDGFTLAQTATEIFWADLNGDGLVDKVEGSGSTYNTRLNLGYQLSGLKNITGLSANQGEQRSINLNSGLDMMDIFGSSLNGSFKLGLNVNRADAFDKVVFMDLTNDGLPDKLSYSSLTGAMDVAINSGNEFQSYEVMGNSSEALNNAVSTGITANFAYPILTFGTPLVGLGVDLKVNVNFEATPNLSFSSNQSAIMDMNGDGAPDLVINDGQDRMAIYYNKIGKSNKLKRVENDLGGSFAIDYELIGNRVGYKEAKIRTNRSTDNHQIFWDMPQGKWVMASLSVDDGLDIVIDGTDVDGVDVMTYEYRYDGGYKSRREREFLGFSRLEVRQPKKRWDLNHSGDYENTSVPAGYNRVSLRESLEFIYERYYSQVLIYHPFTDDSFEGRKRFEYQNQVLVDEIHLLNYDITYKVQNLSDPTDTFRITDTHRTLISHKHNDFEYYSVNQTSNLNQAATTVLSWSDLGECSTVFPALVKEETIVRPLPDSTYIFQNVAAPTSFFTQGTEFTAEYDAFFNVTRYETGSAGANTSYSTNVVDTLHHYYYDSRTFEVSVQDLIDNTTTEFVTTTPIGYSIPDAYVRVVEFTAEAGFFKDTLIIEHYWDENEPDCGGLMFSREGSVPSITVTFKKPVHELHFIEEDDYNINYSAQIIALMEYYAPQTGINNSNATNVLKDHKIYEGATTNPVSRHSKVSNLKAGLGVPIELKQVLSVGQEAQVDLKFDNYGNVTEVKGPLDDNSQRAIQKYKYDSDLATYILEIENPYGETVYHSYDYRNGNLLRTIGLNGYPIHFVYDDMFRLEEVWGPREYYAWSENNVNYPSISFIYDLDGYDPNSNNYNERVPVGVTKHHVNPTAGAYNNLSFSPVSPTAALPNLNGANIPSPLKTATFVDGFGQVVQVRKESSGNNPSTLAYKKMREESGFVRKNEFGWIVRQGWSQLSDPADIPQFRIMNVSSDFTGAGSVEQKVWYDLLGRPELTKTFNGSQEIQTEILYFETDGTYNASSGYLGTMTKLGPSGSSSLNKLNVTDARGFTIEQIGYRGASFTNPELTSFYYNNLGELDSTTNAAGMTTAYTYDNFGRMLSEVHPDRGETKLSYDLAGNLLKTVTPETGATGIVNTYTLGRLIQTDYPLTGNLNDVTYTYGSKGDGKNGAGRIVTVEQGNGFKTDTYEFDIMGNLVREQKLISVPQAGDRRFVTTFSYDSWGRILNMVYPDGEELSYSYDATGELQRILGKLSGQTSQYTILDSVIYNGLGQHQLIKYGNGATTRYDYESSTRRMSTVKLNSNGNLLLDKTFSYDKRGNIAKVINTAPAVTINGTAMGGTYKIHGSNGGDVSYDGLNQVTAVLQEFRDTSVHNITQTVSYSSVGRIKTKTLTDAAGTATDYNFTYNYNSAGEKPHQLLSVVNSQGNNFNFTYNNAGSITRKTEVDGSGSGNDMVQDFCWNEHQTLRAVKNGDDDHADMAHYAYDYTGERVLKSLITGGIVNTNSQGQSVLSLDAPTVYVNPYYIASHYDETVLISKHYYMANQRIASALSHQADTTGFVPSAGYEEGNRSFSTDAIVVDIEASLDCLYGEEVELDWEQMLAPVELGSFMFEDCGSQLETTNASLLSSDTCACEQSTYWSEATGVNCSSLPIIYYYHPDYLGSVEFITDMRGDPYQFFFNTIWGENLQNQLAFNTTAFSSRFRFNGKEWDEETGNFYYGARYYDPKVSVWLSVDPLMGNNPHLSPYNFVSNNPIMRIDPDGMDDGWVEGEGGEMTYDPDVHSQQDLLDQGKSGTYKGEEGVGFNPETGNHVLYNKDGSSFEYSQMLSEVEVDGGKMSDLARTMQNPIVQAIHEGHSDFFAHPATQVVITGVSLMIPVGVGLRFGKGATQAYKAARQAIKVEGTVIQKTFQGLGSLKGLGPLRTSKLLQSKGFVFKGRTPGGYYKYYHPNGAKIQIRPDGQVYRYGGGKGLKYNSDGFFSKLHGQENILR